VNGISGPPERPKARELRPLDWLKLIVLFGVIAAAVVWATRQLTPPDVVPASAPETEFSGERAFAELEGFASEARPIPSPGHTRTQRYLIESIREVGLKPIVRHDVAVDSLPEDGDARAASVTHILARLAGTGSGRPIVLSAHYDTFNGGTPGAMDCGSCVATLLETMRALAAGPQPRRDVFFAFTDAEERASVGVHSLVAEPPLSDADTILNFEAGGRGGAPVVLQVSEQSGGVIDALLEEAPSPVANSIVPVLFTAAQAGDDFEVYDDELNDFAGLDFANFVGRWAYHTDVDNLDEADRGTIQRDGDIALGMTRALSSLDSTPQADDRVFFTALPGVTIVYPESLGLVFAALLTLALVALVVSARRRGMLTLGSVIRAAGATLLALLVAFAAAVAAWELVALVNPGYDQMLSFGRPITYNGGLYMGAFAAMTVALTAVLANRFIARHGAVAMTAGAALVAVFFAWLAISAPGFGYLFVWPALFALLGAAWLLFRSRPGLAWSDALALAVAAIPGVVLISLAVAFIVLGLFGIAASGLPITTLGVPMILVALLVCLLAPQLAATPRWLVPGLAALIAVSFLIAGQATSGFTDERPRPNVVSYELDADRTAAEWISPGGEPDEWTRQFLGEDYHESNYETFLLPAYELPAIAADAPVAELPAPEAEVISDRIEGDGRRLRLRISSPRHAPNLLVDVTAGDPITGASVEGVEIDRATPDDLVDELELLYSAPSARGIELELEIGGSASVALELTDISEGLPDVEGFDPDPRPPDMQPLPTQALDPTIVRRSVEIE
jgi:hypothetical protein